MTVPAPHNTGAARLLARFARPLGAPLPRGGGCWWHLLPTAHNLPDSDGTVRRFVREVFTLGHSQAIPLSMRQTLWQLHLITAGTFVRYDDWPSCIEPDPSKCPPVWGQELAHRHLTETFGIEWKVWDRKVYQVVTCKTCAPTAV